MFDALKSPTNTSFTNKDLFKGSSGGGLTQQPQLQQQSPQQWQTANVQNRQVQQAPASTTTEVTARVQMFNANLSPAPPLPPENILTEQDKQAQILYEQWLKQQSAVLTQQLRYYETEVQKLRKIRKV